MRAVIGANTTVDANFRFVCLRIPLHRANYACIDAVSATDAGAVEYPNATLFSDLDCINGTGARTWWICASPADNNGKTVLHAAG